MVSSTTYKSVTPDLYFQTICSFEFQMHPSSALPDISMRIFNKYFKRIQPQIQFLCSCSRSMVLLPLILKTVKSSSTSFFPSSSHQWSASPANSLCTAAMVLVQPIIAIATSYFPCQSSSKKEETSQSFQLTCFYLVWTGLASFTETSVLYGCEFIEGKGSVSFILCPSG